MLNVAATLQQCCGNLLITSESDVVTTSETDVGTTLIFDRVTTRKRQQQRCDNVVTRSLCQLGRCFFGGIFLEKGYFLLASPERRSFLTISDDLFFQNVVVQ